MIFKQLFYIFLFSFLGEMIAYALPFPVPGSVIGMLSLFVALHFKWIKIEKIKEVGTFLTDNMSLFFVPAGVGLMTNFSIVKDIWWQLVIIVVISCVVTMGVVGLGIECLNREKNKTKGEKNHV